MQRKKEFAIPHTLRGGRRLYDTGSTAAVAISRTFRAYQMHSPDQTERRKNSPKLMEPNTPLLTKCSDAKHTISAHST